MPRTLLDKVWDNHIITQEPGAPAVLYVDLHLVHEVTSPQAFAELRARGLKVRRPDRTVAVVDHSIPTHDRSLPIADPQAAAQVAQLEANCREFGVPFFGATDPRQGIVHVIGPELGLTQPGMTIVCGDSHTATHGAFGALAFGIGTSEVAHVLATQCLLQHKPKSCEVRVEGHLQPGVGPKDIILALIAQIGVGGGTGHVFEYTGSAIRSLSMEGRMTVCNMSIEAGARAGMIAADDTTFEYLAGRPFAPPREVPGTFGSAWHFSWDAAMARWPSAREGWPSAREGWRQLSADPGATYDKTVTLDASALEPMITFGTNPGMAIPITGRVPDPADVADLSRRHGLEKALIYMGLTPGRPLLGHPIDVVFIGSCTNGRLSDLRQAAAVLRGRKVHPRVRCLVVPGSHQVKAAAEAERLDVIFKEAGCEWREPGCSMCIAMNGDQLAAGQYCVSTSNRNFEGRQGPGGRTFLASPLTAAASAVAGAVADPRPLLQMSFPGPHGLAGAG